MRCLNIAAAATGCHSPKEGAWQFFGMPSDQAGVVPDAGGRREAELVNTSSACSYIE